MISRGAHSIKNPDKIHYLRKGRYLCNHACSTTPSKSTTREGLVTCKNCIFKLWKEKGLKRI